MKQVIYILSICCISFLARAQINIPPEPPNWSPSASDVTLNSSCLAGNGRVVLNIQNRSTPVSVYRLEFQGLIARERTVQFEDWGRISLTGRLPGIYNTVVRRDGEIILDTSITIDCSALMPPVSSPEISYINACRDSNGQIFFQFVNPTATYRSYIIEFDGVRNRSTTASPFGQSLRGITGRPDGNYRYTIRSKDYEIESGSLIVDCD